MDALRPWAVCACFFGDVQLILCTATWLAAMDGAGTTLLVLFTADLPDSIVLLMLLPPPELLVAATAAAMVVPPVRLAALFGVIDGSHLCVSKGSWTCEFLLA